MYRKLLAVLLVISYTSTLTLASLKARKHRFSLLKRLSSSSGGGGHQDDSRLYFKHPVTRINRHNKVTLECDVGGTPTPTIHWLKDGERLTQGVYHGFEDDEALYEDRISQEGKPLLRLSTTVSNLFLDCLTPETEGEYSCVAETPKSRIERSTKVVLDRHKYNSIENCLVKKSLEGEAARIYLWTKNRIEFEDATVQLYCRAEGTPAPKITWFNNHGKMITVEDEDEYKVADNGDLVIKDISWMEHMGEWTCQAENSYGIDRKETFLYPTGRDEDEELPL